MSRFASQLCAFEPVSATRARLDRNVALNGLHHVAVYPYALGAADGIAMIQVPPRQIDSANASLVAEVAAADWRSEQVHVMAGDELIAAGVPAPNIIKLDVEGFENDVLRGLCKTLDERRPLILMELSESGRRRFGGESNLRDLLYDDAALFSVSRHGGLAPFDYARSFDVAVFPS